MNSLLRSVVSSGGREIAVKESLVVQLSNSVKQIQLEQTKKNPFSYGCDDTASLCTVLEAIFIHGLKETFINRVTQVIGTDPDQRPEPSFWGPLLVFSHRELIDQVNSLNLVTTDVGRCRAWLRLALNDCLLSSYLGAMRRENSALKSYYQRSAFVCDTELLDVVQRLVEGIECCLFSFTSNSSLLNTWTNSPLLLAGLWMPPMRPCPIPSGVDVASTLNYMLEEVPASNSILSYSPASSFGPILACSEDEALKIILGTPVDEAPIARNCRFNDNTYSDESECNNKIKSECTQVKKIPLQQDDRNKATTSVDDGSSSFGNSLIGRVGWSSSFQELPNKQEMYCDASDQTGQIAPHSHMSLIAVPSQNRVTLLRSPSEPQSYHSLLESYNLVSGGFVKTPDLRDFLHRFDNASESSLDMISGSEAEDPPIHGLGFEVVPISPTSLFDIPEFGSMVQQLGKLATEPGLDVQNYTCKGCGHPIGINFAKARVCHFDGGYFCCECHAEEEWVVPARIIHNWDFKRYSVSRKAATFLDEIQHHPLLDLKIINPRIYLVVEEMAQLQALRHQLNLLRAYLFTCREPVIEDLQKRVWPREYLYEHVHLYSVADLLQSPSGNLAQILQKVVAFAKSHVLSCWLCSQKGFICEVCSNPKVIYPFDMDSTFKCGLCSAVYHIGCLNASKPCPKCVRQQKRENISEIVYS